MRLLQDIFQTIQTIKFVLKIYILLLIPFFTKIYSGIVPGMNETLYTLPGMKKLPKNNKTLIGKSFLAISEKIIFCVSVNWSRQLKFKPLWHVAVKWKLFWKNYDNQHTRWRKSHHLTGRCNNFANGVKLQFIFDIFEANRY